MYQVFCNTAITKRNKERNKERKRKKGRKEGYFMHYYQPLLFSVNSVITRPHKHTSLWSMGRPRDNK
jgi:hypothetical protein